MTGTSSKNNIRVRFAPSPTGRLHVGSFRTALFNWLFARKNRGCFILRIEDTDQQRSEQAFLESQLNDLKWIGLNWNEGPEVGGNYGPYFQMERLPLYSQFAQKLVEEGKAYFCFCTPEELKNQREEARKEGNDPGYQGHCRKLADTEMQEYRQEGRIPCIRFKVTDRGETLIQDRIKGEVAFQNQDLHDFVIIKSDGIPTYNFAVVVDDYLMEISHVIRGDEHMSNTHKQALL
ncbi:MAG: glutamate--tRNA ligase, partial [Vulcanimicrobiota bacterium]